MHHLIQLDDITGFAPIEGNIGNVFQADGVYYPVAFAKCNALTLGELYGYLLAAQLGLRTPQAQAFVYPYDGEFYSERVLANRIGLIVEAIQDCAGVERIAWQNAVTIEPVQVARALVLSVFGATEPFEIFRKLSDNSIWFIDLDLSYNFYAIPEDQPGRDLGAGMTIIDQRGSFIDEYSKTAQELGVLNHWLSSALDLVSGNPPDLRISGHPDEHALNTFAHRRLEIRLAELRDWIG